MLMLGYFNYFHLCIGKYLSGSKAFDPWVWNLSSLNKNKPILVLAVDSSSTAYCKVSFIIFRERFSKDSYRKNETDHVSSLLFCLCCISLASFCSCFYMLLVSSLLYLPSDLQLPWRKVYVQDPTKVTRTGIVDAASVAGLLAMSGLMHHSSLDHCRR